MSQMWEQTMSKLKKFDVWLSNNTVICNICAKSYLEAVKEAYEFYEEIQPDNEKMILGA